MANKAYTNISSVNVLLWQIGGTAAQGSVYIGGTGATIGSTRFTSDVIPNVESIINSRIAHRFKVPFADRPALIQAIATKLAAGEALKIATQYRDDSASSYLYDKTRLEWYEAVAWLDKLAKGEMSLLGEKNESIPQKRDSESMADAEDPIFEVESAELHKAPGG